MVASPRWQSPFVAAFDGQRQAGERTERSNKTVGPSREWMLERLLSNHAAGFLSMPHVPILI